MALAEAWVDIKANLSGLKTGLLEANKMLQVMLGGVSGGLAAMALGPAQLGLKSLTDTIAHGVTVAMGFENQYDDLRDRLESTGQSVDSNMQKFDALGRAIQDTTAIGRTQTNQLLNQAMNLGLNAEQARKFTTAALGLAQATGIPVATALDGIVKQANGMRNGLDRAVPAIAAAVGQEEKLAVISRLAGQGLGEMWAGTSQEKGEQLKNKITDLYEKLGQLFLPTVRAVIGQLSTFADWLLRLASTCQAFGIAGGEAFAGVGTMGDWMGSVIETVFQNLGAAIVWLVKQWSMIGLTVKVTGTLIAAAFDYSIEYVRVFGVNAWESIKWFFTNFGAICKTSVDFMLVAFTNLGMNLKKLWEAVLGFISGKGWNFNATPLLEGFKSSVDKMPEFVKAKDFGYGKQIDDLLGQYDTMGTKFDAIWKSKAKKPIEDTKKELKAMVADLQPIQNIREDQKKGKKEKSDAGKMSGAAEVWKNIQTAIMKGSEDRQLAATMNQTKVMEKMETHLETIADKKGIGLDD